MNMPVIREPPSISPPLTTAGLFRRLASGLYDTLIMLAICMLATFLIMPFTHGRAFESFYAQHAGVKLVYQLGLLALGFAFFGGFWSHGGQTIGMRTWKLRTVCMDGTPLGWRRALIRYLSMLIPWLLLLLASEFLIHAYQEPPSTAYVGMAIGILALVIAAIIWPVLDARHFAWHDHLSSTRVVLLRSPDKTNRHGDGTDARV